MKRIGTDRIPCQSGFFVIFYGLVRDRCSVELGPALSGEVLRVDALELDTAKLDVAPLGDRSDHHPLADVGALPGDRLPPGGVLSEHRCGEGPPVDHRDPGQAR